MSSTDPERRQVDEQEQPLVEPRHETPDPGLRPVHDAPDDDPVDDDPVDDDPVDEDPVDDDPVDEDPVDEDPVDEDPVGEDTDASFDTADLGEKPTHDPSPEQATGSAPSEGTTRPEDEHPEDAPEAGLAESPAAATVDARDRTSPEDEDLSRSAAEGAENSPGDRAVTDAAGMGETAPASAEEPVESSPHGTDGDAAPATDDRSTDPLPQAAAAVPPSDRADDVPEPDSADGVGEADDRAPEPEPVHEDEAEREREPESADSPPAPAEAAAPVIAGPTERVTRPASGAAAWRRLGLMAKPRPSKANFLGALLALLLGAAFVTQIQLTQERGLSELSQSELIRVLDDVSVRNSRLDAQIQELEDTRDRLQSGAGTSAEALTQARKRADTLAILAGTVGVRGPGIIVTIDDPEGNVRGPVILDLIQELRDAGAESIDVGGVRVVASSFVGQRDGEILVDGVPVERPIVITAIGEPKTLSSAMNIPGGIVETVRQRGGAADVMEAEELQITSLHPPDELTYATPVE